MELIRGDRPLIFLDADGPLITFAARPRGCTRPDADPLAEQGNPLLDRLDPEDGRRLLGSVASLSGRRRGWRRRTRSSHHASACRTCRSSTGRTSTTRFQHGLHWKTTFLTRWAAGRPFVWLDDEITDADRWWVAAHHPGRALLHRVDPYIGLTEADFTVIRQWLAQ